jgi:hypothetical protein
VLPPPPYAVTPTVATVPNSRDSGQVFLPTQYADLFGNPPTLPHEDNGAYYRLVEELTKATTPADLIDWMWIRQIADLTWDILRMQRTKTGVIQNSLHESLARMLDQRMDFRFDDHPADRSTVPGRRKASNYYLCPLVREEVESLFACEQVGKDVVYAVAFADQIGTLEKIERLIAAAEARRDNALREIEERRAAKGQALRVASSQLIEAQA